MTNIIDIKHLKKSFKDIKAVDDISFQVKEGSLFAFLGVNGAGKSTTINIICGDYKKDDGQIIISGYDVDKNFDQIKSLLGIVYQDSVLDKQLSVKDNLICRASLYNISKEEFEKRLHAIDKLLDISPLLKRKVATLSGGQRRRIDIARAILHQPKILILDEPTTGLDPNTRKIVWKAINILREKYNLTVFLTTHYMEEASEADDIVILDSGKIIAQGTPLELKNKYTGDFIKLYNVSEEDIKILNMPYKVVGNCIKIEVKSTQEATKLIIQYPDLFQDYEITKGQMDDVFISVTGKQLQTGERNE